jgi:hypothetical protein
MPSPLRVSPTFSDLHPTGDFQAVISSIEETQGLYGKQFKFLINTDATFKELGYALFYFTSQNFSARSKLGLLIHSVLGKTPNDFRGQELDLQELIDHLFMVTIEHQVKNGKERAVIVDHDLYDERQSNGHRATDTGGEIS